MMNDFDEYMEHPQRITYDGKRMRTKLINRKVTDYNSGIVSYVKVSIKFLNIPKFFSHPLRTESTLEIIEIGQVFNQ